jgi:hypothetical protein
MGSEFRRKSYFGESESKARRFCELIIEGKSDIEARDILRQGKNNYYILLLIMAREYYYIGDFKNGDKYLNKIESLRVKPKYLVKILEEIKGRRKFYSNESELSLILKL